MMSQIQKNYRESLQTIHQERMTFKGSFERYGMKSGYLGREEKTILLHNVVRVDTGEEVTDHLWFNFTKGFAKLGELETGQIVEFDARVKMYEKGYKGRRDDMPYDNPPSIDYKLSHPTKIKLVHDK